MFRHTSIHEVGLSPRIAEALDRAGIDTAEKFISAKGMDLIRGIGKSSMDEILPMVEKVSKWECFQRKPNPEELDKFVDLWCHGLQYDLASDARKFLFTNLKDGVRLSLQRVLKDFRFDNGESVIVSDELVDAIWRRTLIRISIDILDFCIDDLTPDDIGRSIVGNILSNKIVRFKQEAPQKR